MAIYAIQAGTGGPIKIGRAVDPATRLKALQTGNPELLRIVGTRVGPDPGVDPYGAEEALHQQFDDERLRGEWFRPSTHLVDYIKTYMQGLPRGEPSPSGLDEGSFRMPPRLQSPRQREAIAKFREYRKKVGDAC